MTERIFKNWKTSIIGVIILGIAGLAVFTDRATLAEASAFMIAGFGLFFLKDPSK